MEDKKEIVMLLKHLLQATRAGEDIEEMELDDGGETVRITYILTDSMTAFGDGAEDASRYADVLATTQAKSNTTVGLLGEAFKYVAPLQVLININWRTWLRRSA